MLISSLLPVSAAALDCTSKRGSTALSLAVKAALDASWKERVRWGPVVELLVGFGASEVRAYQ